MRDMMRLLFGHEAGILSGLFGADDADGFGMADRARNSGEWCGSTPGRGAAGDGLGGLPGARNSRGKGYFHDHRNGR
jgi:hypothetical protein